MSDFLILFGENVRLIRKQRGLTQEELAEVTGLQNTYIGGIERGERNISLETLEKVAKGLNINPKWLFDYKNLDIEHNDGFSKNTILDIHRGMLENRSEDEIKLIHRTVKDMLLLLDNKEKS
jgi:transcriptional regulator with XRE-family HTH domain